MAKAETLDDLIDARGIPVGEVAERAGLAARSLWMLRKGRISHARAETVAGLAKALKVDAARVRAACKASFEAAGWHKAGQRPRRG